VKAGGGSMELYVGKWRVENGFFCIFFWRARVCRPLLSLCRTFMIFE
jgi:hypothetical protein